MVINIIIFCDLICYATNTYILVIEPYYVPCVLDQMAPLKVTVVNGVSFFT